MGAAAWVAEPTPALPHVLLRRAHVRGGKFAIVRDVSASMEGERAQWVSAVIARMLELCRARGLAVGYLEFNHTPLPPPTDEPFFSTNYARS